MAFRQAVMVILAALAVPALAQACPFCTQGGKTLTQEVDQATLVLYGKLTNPNDKNETVEIEIEDVIKDDASRGKKMRLTLSRYLTLDTLTDKDRFLVFCDLYNGKFDPFRGLNVKTGSKLPQYIRGALKVKDKATAERLKFFFTYLDDPDVEISNDSYREFANCDYKDFSGMARSLPADRVVKWLNDADTPAFRIGLYASMLGHCGKEKDAVALKKILDDEDRRAGSGIDGVLAAYAMLKPKDGWTYLSNALKNNKEEFTFRYAALRAVRFLHEFRNDIVSKADLENAVCAMLGQDDIADLAIEDLRKWQAWGKADKVLAVRNTAAFKMPIVQRALLRYCLECKDNAEAKAYVVERRKADAEGVEEAEELLKLEKTPAKPKIKDTTKKQ